MSGIENNFVIKIEKRGESLSSALYKFAQKHNLEISDGSISSSEWTAMLDKLDEIQNARQANGKASIFTGGTARNDWKNNYVVHEGQQIEFTADEMSAIYSAMGVTFNAEEVATEIAEENSGEETSANDATEGSPEHAPANDGNATAKAAKPKRKSTPQAPAVNPEPKYKPDSDGKYRLTYDIQAVKGASALFTKIEVVADTIEEFEAKIEQLKKLKTIDPQKNYSDAELNKQQALILECLNSDDVEIQRAAAIKARTTVLKIKNKDTIVNALAKMKNPTVLSNFCSDNNKLIPQLPESCLKTLYNLTKDTNFVAKCNSNPSTDNLINDIKYGVLYANNKALSKEILASTSDAFKKGIKGYSINYEIVLEAIQANKFSNMGVINLLTCSKQYFTTDQIANILPKLKQPLKAEEITAFNSMINCCIKDPKERGRFHVVTKGESYYDIVAKYAHDNKKVQRIEDEKGWDDKRKLQAYRIYAKHLGSINIAKDLGLIKPNGYHAFNDIKAGQIIDFGKVKEWKQPNALCWNAYYKTNWYPTGEGIANKVKSWF